MTSKPPTTVSLSTVDGIARISRYWAARGRDLRDVVDEVARLITSVPKQNIVVGMRVQTRCCVFAEMHRYF